MPFGSAHYSLRALAQAAAQSFFSRIQVEGQEEVPREGPLIAVSNHWNAAADPAMLSCFFPHGRKLHYWAKSTLFKPGVIGNTLLNAGNIPVDRNNKDNQKLFAKTFDSFKYGECVAIFPEGGSYTMPGLKEFKDGASWAALEYAKNIRDTGNALSDGGFSADPPENVVIVVAGISYTDKTKYRSSAVVQYAPSIHIEPYIDEFYTDPKAAVKKLTKAIRDSMLKVTANAPNWDVLNAATMGRKILWVEEASIPLAKFRDICQTLIDLFAAADQTPAVVRLRAILLEYHMTLRSTKLTHYVLAGHTLPATLDPSIPHPLPTRFRVAFSLFTDTLGSLIRLPFFILPLIVHLPIYLVSKYSLRFSELEEDTAQNKMALGLILAMLLYATLFGLAWFLFFATPVGGFVVAGFLWLFAVYHNTLIDDNYNASKRLMGSWRVLVGIWAPHAKAEAVAALQSFGISEHIEGENEIRRVLRLRLEATTALAEYLEGMRESGGAEAEVVEKLVGWGGKIPGRGGRGKGKGKGE